MMKNIERGVGILIVIAAIAFFILYVYLLLLSQWKEIVMSMSMLSIIGIIVAAVIWLGLAIAKTPRKVKDR